jgi:hypothetical protein
MRRSWGPCASTVLLAVGHRMQSCSAERNDSDIIARFYDVVGRARVKPNGGAALRAVDCAHRQNFARCDQVKPLAAKVYVLDGQCSQRGSHRAGVGGSGARAIAQRHQHDPIAFISEQRGLRTVVRSPASQMIQLVVA